MKRLVTGLASVAVLALALTACTPTATEPAVETDGELTVGAGHVISQLNPAIRTFAWEQVLYPLVWSGLTRWTPEGEITADLATEWEANEAQDEWTFTLREDVTFHDGKPLTAADVIAAFEYHLDPETAARERTRIGVIESMSAPDDYTVVFTLAQSFAVFPIAVTEIRIIDMESLDVINTAPNGTGPFTVVDFVPDDHVTLERYDGYFGEAPKLATINLVKTADATAATTALRTGDIDVMYDVSYADAGGFSSDPDISIVAAEPYHWAQVFNVDNTSAPFDNVLARQALSYALDRDKVVELAYHGMAIASPTNNLVASDAPFFAASGLVDYSYDLDKAKELFSEAGVNEGDTITWWGPAGIQPEKVTIAEILKDSLGQIGINLDIQLVETSEWTAKFLPAGQSYGGFIAHTGSEAVFDPAYIFSRVPRAGTCACNYVNEELEAEYKKAVTIGDKAERDEAFMRIQEIVSQEVPVIVPVITSMLSGVRSNVSGVWSNSGGTQLHLESAVVQG